MKECKANIPLVITVLDSQGIEDVGAWLDGGDALEHLLSILRSGRFP